MSDQALTSGRIGKLDQVADRQQAGSTQPYPTTQPPADSHVPRLVELLRKLQLRRFGMFSGIGAFVLVLGIAMQWALIACGVGKTPSYILQGVFSVELSFCLNRWVTWADRDVNLIMALLKWNLQKLALTVPNVLVFAWLEHLGWNWLLANIVLTIFFTVANYLGGNIYSFRVRHQARHRAPGDRAKVRSGTGVRPAAVAQAVAAESVAPGDGALRVGTTPEVSVVIPAKNSQRTIRKTVDALLAQDYPGLIEVIVVGDVGDQSWPALADITDPRLLILEHEATPGLRDPAVKRDIGLQKANGTLLALADSDIIMDADWLTRAVDLLLAQGGGVVCGGMRAAEDGFWGRFVDRNIIAAKTPRVPRSYMVTAENFGKRGRKPPITANVLMSRAVYDAVPMDCTWSYGYEDYEWFWRMAKAGHKILYAAGLTGRHHHRRSFQELATEYRRSATGCERFIRQHGDSPLSKKRSVEAVLLPSAAVVGVVIAGAAVAAGYLLEVVAILGATAVFLTVRELIKARRLEAVAYPAVGLALGVTFVAQLGWKLITNRPVMALSPAVASGNGILMYGGVPLPVYDGVVLPADDGIVAPADPGSLKLAERPELDLPPVGPDRPVGSGSGPEPRRRDSASRRVLLSAAFGVVLVAAAAIRFWQLANKPDWQYDEGTYWDIAHNLVVNGTLNEHITFGAKWTPFLFQPPLYLIMLAKWFELTGPTIYHARILGVIFSLCTLVLLWRLICRQSGAAAALFVAIPIAFDGWLLFIQRVSYIENLVLLLVVAGLLLYQRALDRPSWWRFALAGVVIGLALCVKYDAAYVVVAVLLSWAFLRSYHKGHLVLLGAVAAMAIAEQVSFSLMFDLPGHKWWIDQSLTQVGRVLGVGLHRGSLESPLQLLHLLFAQYKVFLPSLAIALGGLALVVVRLVRCYRQRSMQPVRAQAPLYAWAVAGAVVFGFSSLRYQQYFALALVPLYCVWWTEVWRWKRSSTLKIAAVALAVVLGLTSFWVRVGSQSDNVFEELQQYAAVHIPAHAVVIADESIGDLIKQPYCQEQHSEKCLWQATYAITWVTYLQSTFKLGDPDFHLMMTGAQEIWSRTGFNGTIEVWRLKL